MSSVTDAKAAGLPSPPLAELFFHKHTPVQDIVETLALLAEGARISNLSWLREATRQG